MPESPATTESALGLPTAPERRLFAIIMGFGIVFEFGMIFALRWVV